MAFRSPAFVDVLFNAFAVELFESEESSDVSVGIFTKLVCCSTRVSSFDGFLTIVAFETLVGAVRSDTGVVGVTTGNKILVDVAVSDLNVSFGVSEVDVVSSVDDDSCEDNVSLAAVIVKFAWA